jgi:glutamate mutase epsilon subunit
MIDYVYLTTFVPDNRTKCRLGQLLYLRDQLENVKWLNISNVPSSVTTLTSHRLAVEVRNSSLVVTGGLTVLS